MDTFEVHLLQTASQMVNCPIRVNKRIIYTIKLKPDVVYFKLTINCKEYLIFSEPKGGSSGLDRIKNSLGCKL